MRRIRSIAAFAALALLAPAAFAQGVPADQSCGGLLCDTGILGHKIEAAPPSPPPVAAVVVPAPPPVVETTREPRRRAAMRKLARAVVQHAPAVAARPIRVAPVVAATAPAPPAAAPAYTGPTVIFQSIDPRFQLDP